MKGKNLYAVLFCAAIATVMNTGLVSGMDNQEQQHEYMQVKAQLEELSGRLAGASYVAQQQRKQYPDEDLDFVTNPDLRTQPQNSTMPPH